MAIRLDPKSHLFEQMPILDSRIPKKQDDITTTICSIFSRNILYIINDYIPFDTSIAEHYDVAFQSPLITDPEDARIFLIAEAHLMPSCRTLNGKFITERSTSKAILV